MITCTFFGHRFLPYSINDSLVETIIDLIENKSVNNFYVGSNGEFDETVAQCLSELAKQYPHIRCSIVLAYMPSKHNKYIIDTVYPEELANSFPKYAIDKRNMWMIDNSDYVITCVNHSYGGAAKFKMIAEKKGKLVYNIGNKKE